MLRYRIHAVAEQPRRAGQVVTSRRAILKGGIAATTLIAWRGGSTQTLPCPVHRPDHLIVDPRSPLSGILVDHAGSNVIPCFVGTGDITSLWFEVLDPLWRSRPSIVAGETSLETIFCLQRLASDYGMRVEYRADRVAGHFGTELRIHARREVLDRALPTAWAPHVQAACLLDCPVAEGPIAMRTVRIPGPAPDRQWVGWVMVPRSRA